MSARQQSLFDAEPADWEIDADQLKCVATVAFPKGPDSVFDYETPAAFQDENRPDRLLTPGRRVRVPFGRGNREAVGYCVTVETKRVTTRLKPISAVMDDRALLSPLMLRLTRWMSQYYLCPWGQVLECVVPAGVRSQAGTRQVNLLSVPPDVLERLEQLKPRSKQQACALRMLATAERPLTAAELAERAGCTAGPIRELLRQGFVEAKAVRIATGEMDETPQPPESPLELSADQRQALTAIVEVLDARKARGILLHGVTGSGKTEVYLQAIERVISFGRQAIVLVPEISLTPQTVSRFRARFDQVAVLHSHLSDVDRHRYWQRISQGEVQVVVGARSAVFAPTRNLGLIVIDEEHEATFKQDSAPRYHARDVAWRRAQSEEVPLVLGSATPSLETWQRSESGEFARLSLPKRVRELPMPDVVTVDLRDSAHTRFSRGAISRPLHQAMHAALRDGGQVILLLNRRGYSTHIQCPSCGYALTCRDCDLSLTFHRQHNAAVCHYCEFQQPPPTSCPECQSPSIRYGGLGTQKLEDEVRSRFSDYVCARMDADSMRRRGSHENVLSAFRRGEVQILLGTQMIAKGLDFPRVTLVGVVNADTALHLADFRAAERTFQLVAQVAGRTGRGEHGGRVLVQTLNPEHPALEAAARHDFNRFARRELEIRRAAHYPPFGSMARVVVRGTQEDQSHHAAEHLGALLKGAATAIDDVAAPIRVLGPGPAPIPRLRGEYRFHLQLQAPEPETLNALLRAAIGDFKPPREIRWIVDIDPWDMQ